jgi:zinc protease
MYKICLKFLIFLFSYQYTIISYAQLKLKTQFINNFNIKKGEVIFKTENKYLGIIDYTLSNGVSVIIKPTMFKTDEILMKASRLGGYFNYPLIDKDNAKYAPFIIQKMGLKYFQRNIFKKALPNTTTNLEPYINPYEEGFQGYTDINNFENFLQLIYLYNTSAKFKKIQYNSYLIRNKLNLNLNMSIASPNFIFSDSIMKIKYNNSTWIDSPPNIKDLEKINSERSFVIYNDIFNNAFAMHYTFVGNIDTIKFKPLIEKYLGGLPWEPKERNFSDKGLRPFNKKIESEIKYDNGKDSYVTISFGSEISFDKINIVKLSMLSDIFNYEIINPLKKVKDGLIDGSSKFMFYERPYPHFEFSINFKCLPQNVDKFSNDILRHINNIKENGCFSFTLSSVKKNLALKIKEDLNSNVYWLNLLSDAWINQVDFKSISHNDKILENVSIDDIKNLTKRYINLDKMFKVVLNPQ